ncbi:DUF4974 domain-containing protein [Prolixibacteraceae bacterium JC049]|nr:DUF4974 domain-containing protein [Prolixibacteraceae bacterium JC049]
MKTNNDKSGLIAKWISGNASSEEHKELTDWQNNSEENKKTVARYKKIWEQGCEHISSEQIKTDQHKIQKAINRNLVLRLEKAKRVMLQFKVAALLAFPVALALGWLIWSNSNSTNQSAQLYEVRAPKGHVAKCFLPDGSEVWINSESTLKYDASRFNTSQREVSVEGEAFFNVTKNKSLPFSVKNKLASIVVTGTQFNVKAYANSKQFETVLEEGSIELKIAGYRAKTLKVKPGERVVFNAQKRTLNVKRVDVELYSSWRKGQILFKDATLNELITELERIYDLKIHLEDDHLKTFRFRGMFGYNNNIIDALEKIKKTAGLDYYIMNKEVWLRAVE